VSFFGPKCTKFENNEYTVKFIPKKQYPFKPLEGFFVGQAPCHKFYIFDTNDDNRNKRVTNLANNDFGLMYGVKCTMFHVIDYVTRIQYSLTPIGEEKFESFMKSYPIVDNV
jgi:hypothetical protein